MNYYETYVLRKSGVKMEGKLPSRFVVKAISVKASAQTILDLYRKTKNVHCIKFMRVFRLQSPKGAGIFSLHRNHELAHYAVVRGRLVAISSTEIERKAR